MNPKTLTTIVLAMLVANENLTQAQAEELLSKADSTLSDYVIDALTLDDMVKLFTGQEIDPGKKPSGLIV